jgi:hypothetical protein
MKTAVKMRILVLLSALMLLLLINVSASCSETDNGRDYKQQGTIYSDNLGTKTDNCKDAYYMTEYYCSGNKGYSTTIKCTDGCLNGACKAASCSETDNGRDYMQQGTIYSNNLGTKTDVCKNSDYLTEYYCSGNRGYSTNKKCEFGCLDGACETTTSDYCSDSDGGIDYREKGTIYSDNLGTSTDTCEGDTLIEYYCTGRMGKMKSYKCVDGCEDGECQKPSCSESDDGKDYTQQGTTYSNNMGTSTDSCSGDSLTEYYCSGNRAYRTTKKCSYGCADGACEASTSDYCYDSDQRDYTEKGKTYTNQGTKTDTCTDKKTLTEYYCIRSRAYSEKILCDYICKDGACTTSTSSDYCSETDGGKDYTQLGTTYSNNLGTKTDKCSGNTLTEYYCSGKEGYSMSYACGYGCANGACKTASASTATCPSSWGSGWTCKRVDGKIEACKATNCWCSDGDWETWVTGKCPTTSTSTSWTCYSDWTCTDKGSYIKAVKGPIVYCTYDKTGAKNNQNVDWHSC